MKFYRYFSMLFTDGPRVILAEFNLIKETPCGWWIQRMDQWNYLTENKRWVSKTTRKRYAYPTKEEALVNFKARKRRQIAILEYQLDRAKQEQIIAKNMTTKEE